MDRNSFDITAEVISSINSSHHITLDLFNSLSQNVGGGYIPVHLDYFEITLELSSPIPEPSTALLMGLGLAGLASRRR